MCPLRANPSPRAQAEREKQHAEALAKLTKERDELKAKWEASKAEAQRYKGEADRLKELNSRLQAEIPPLKAEAKAATLLVGVTRTTLVNEVKLLERERRSLDGQIEHAKRMVRLEYESYLAVLVQVIATDEHR